MNNGILATTDPELDAMNTYNDSEMNKEAEERKLNRMAKVHDFFGDVAGPPKPTYYTERVLRSKQPNDRRTIHFEHGRDRQSILVTLST
jgi:hypothetical protein